MNKKFFLCTLCAVIFSACAVQTSTADSAAENNIPKITETDESVSAETEKTEDINLPETTSADTVPAALYDKADDENISREDHTDAVIYYTETAVPDETAVMTTHENAAVTAGYSLPADTVLSTETEFSDVTVFNDLEPSVIDGYLVRCTSGDVLFVSENYDPIIIGADGDFPERQTGDAVSIKVLLLMESYPMQIPDDSEFYFSGGYLDVNDMPEKIINDLIDLRNRGYIVPEMPDPKDNTDNDTAFTSDVCAYRMTGVYYDDQNGNNFILTENREAVIIYGDVDFSNLSDGDFITVSISEIEESYPGRGMIYDLEKLPFAYDGSDPEIITEVLNNLESDGYILT